MSIQFRVEGTDGAARAGRLLTPHGPVETPVFMPVGTQATIKGLTPEQVRTVGASLILANTYHLALRPGDALIRELGGLHRFMHWDGPILTDSGGFQVFSLATLVRISDGGATFRSHIDGAILELSPERAVEIQENLGSDIAMVLDECPPADANRGQLEQAVRRTIAWAERCQKRHQRRDQALFAIVQGGLDRELRRQCAEALIALDFPGYALGGFSVGETPEQMRAAPKTYSLALPRGLTCLIVFCPPAMDAMPKPSPALASCAYAMLAIVETPPLWIATAIATAASTFPALISITSSLPRKCSDRSC